MDLGTWIDNYGLTLGVLIWLGVGVAALIRQTVPGIIDSVKERVRDEQEHRQDIEKVKTKVDQVTILAAQHSRSFTEEQITQITAEILVELQQANEFTRREVSSKLDIIIQRIEILERKVEGSRSKTITNNSD